MIGTLVEAGAGCGKTHTIVSKYIEALGYDPTSGKALPAAAPRLFPQQIWLLTFTEDAASEMLERILARLDTLNLSELKQEVLENSVIGTIHSLCFRILRPQLHRLGFEGPAKIVSGAMADIVRSRHILSALGTFEKRVEVMGYFESAQLVRLTLSLWSEAQSFNMDALQISFDSFKEKFEKDLAELRENCLNAHKILAADKSLKMGWLADASDAFQKTSKAEQRLALKTLGFTRGSKALKTAQPELYKKLQNLRDFMKANLDLIFDPQFHALEAQALQYFCEFFIHAKLESPKLLDFNALESELLELVKNSKNLLEYIPPRLLIIDESQDTSSAQSSILQGLSNAETEFFVVGDPKQSIYGFRGADINVFSKFKSELKLESLSTSRRSDAALLQYQNAFQQALFSEFTNSYDPAPQSLLAWEKLAADRPPLKSSHPTRILWGHDTNNHYFNIFKDFQFRREQSSAPATHAVLFFKWSSIFEFSELCRSQGIPFVVSGDGILESHHLTDLFGIFLENILDPESKDLSAGARRFGLQTNSQFELSPELRAELEMNTAPQIFAHFCKVFDPLRWSLGDLWTAAMGRFLQSFQEERIFLETQLEDLLRIINNRRDLSTSLPELDLERLPENCLILSTLHGSKGLEYDFVYLLEMPKQNESRSTFFLDDSLGLTLNTQIKFENQLVPTLQSVLPKNKKTWKEFSEKKRLLYVAMTRAKRGLSFFPTLGPASSETKASPLNFIGLDTPPRHSLSLWIDLTRKYLASDVAIDEILPEGLSEQTQLNESTSFTREMWNWPLETEQRKYENYQSQYMGVSTFLGTDAKTFYKAKKEKSSKVDFQELGTELHRYLEVWNGEVTQLESLLLDNVQKDLIKSALTKIRSHPELKDYFYDLKNSPHKILREMPLLKVQDDVTLFGICDALWLPDSSTGVIIDWKGSQSLQSFSSDKRIQKIREQLRIYAASFNGRFQKMRILAVGIELEGPSFESRIIVNEDV